MPAFKVEIEGVDQLNVKLSQLTNFLGKNWNKTTLKVGKYGTQKFRDHIDQEKTKSGTSFKRTPQLEETYADRKQKKYGFVHPILKASGKMYDDIKFKINTSWKHFASGGRIRLTFALKTLRSTKIAGYHVKGIMTLLHGLKIRNPWFWTRGEKTWIVRMYNKATKDSIKQARLKSTKGI